MKVKVQEPYRVREFETDLAELIASDLKETNENNGVVEDAKQIACACADRLGDLIALLAEKDILTLAEVEEKLLYRNTWSKLKILGRVE